MTSDEPPGCHEFDVKRWNRDPFARREFLSSDVVDWPALLIEEVASERIVDEAHIPASADFQIVLVIDGHAAIQSSADRRWRSAAYVPGQISMTPPGRPAMLRWRAEDGPGPRTLHAVIPYTTMTAALQQLGVAAGEAGSMPDYLAMRDPVIASSIRALRRGAAAGLEPLYGESAAWHLAVHLLAEHRREPIGTITIHDRRVAQVMDFIHDNLAASFTLDDLAVVAQLSPFHFARSWKAATGQTPYRFVLETRLTAARRLLATSSVRVSDVAQACGFATSSHFAASFRRRFGASPTQYRAEVLAR